MIAEADVSDVVRGVPGVIGCHQIRTRGSADHVFLDLHVWLPAEMPLVDAHALSHVVKDRVMAALPADQGRAHPHRAAARPDRL